MTLVVGIDPGNTGAIAFLSYETGELYDVKDMPTTQQEVSGTSRTKIDAVLFAECIDKATRELPYDGNMVTFTERIQAVPRFNKNTGKYDLSQGGTANIAFGRGGGIIEGYFAALRVSVYEIEASKWKPVMGCSKDKEQSMAVARKIWPDKMSLFKLKTKHGRAEAALVGLYGIRHHKNVVIA